MISMDTLRAYRNWWNRTNAEPLLLITAWDGAPGPPVPDNDHDWWFDFPSRFAREAYWLDHTLRLGQALPHLFINFGPGVLGACMGGTYEYDRHTFWFTRPVLERLEMIEDFRIREDNRWWQAVWAYTEYALEHARDRYLVSITDIGGGMDVLAGLRGSEALLTDLVDRPQAVAHALAVVYEEWWRLYDTLSRHILERQGYVCAWNGIPAAQQTYTLQNDLSCMISRQHFRTFDLPYLRELCRRIPYPMYHLDGPGAVQHAEALLEIEELCAIQWVPGSGTPGGDAWSRSGGMETWENLLMEIQRAGKGLELFLHPDDATHWLSRLDPRGLLIKVPCASADRAYALAEQLGLD